MKKIFYLGLALSVLVASCSKEDDKYYGEPLNPGGTMELQGGEGGAMAKNSVYVDFSTGEQTAVERGAWHLALHNGSEFGVKLNGTIGSRATEAASATTVGTVLSQADHDSYREKLAPSMGSGDFTTADQINSDTDLAGTVIKKDKVYIYCSGEGGNELYKVSVTENGSGYTVTYALWNASDVKTVNIAKEGDYNFTGISFTTNKKVDIQPAKDAWDLVWGRTTYTSAMAAGVPFVVSDVVFLNTKAGVQAQEIAVTETVTYESYTAEEAAKTQFSGAIDVIGSNWRNGGGPTTGPSVKADRFYVIKDNEGNIYKLGFISMNEGADGGKRGYPEIKYALLVEAK